MSSSVNPPIENGREYETGGRNGVQTQANPGVGRRAEQNDVHRDAQPNIIAVQTPDRRDDGIRWGPVWAGVVVALAVFLVLEFLFFALGWLTLDPGVNDPGSSVGLITGILALIAFFIGGLVAGKTAMWRDVPNGILHGVVVAALGVTVILLLTLLGGGALLGTAGNVASQVVSLRSATNVDVSQAQIQQAVTNARHAAGWAALGLGLTILAAALGGLAGARMRPGDDKDNDVSTATVNTGR